MRATRAQSSSDKDFYNKSAFLFPELDFLKHVVTYSQAFSGRLRCVIVSSISVVCSWQYGVRVPLCPSGRVRLLLISVRRSAFTAA